MTRPLSLALETSLCDPSVRTGQSQLPLSPPGVTPSTEGHSHKCTKQTNIFLSQAQETCIEYNTEGWDVGSVGKMLASYV